MRFNEHETDPGHEPDPSTLDGALSLAVDRADGEEPLSPHQAAETIGELLDLCEEEQFTLEARVLGALSQENIVFDPFAEEWVVMYSSPYGQLTARFELYSEACDFMESELYLDQIVMMRQQGEALS